MIDRALRDRYASALRQLLSGQVTNWQFEGITKGECLDSHDGVLVPIYWRAWTLYSDGAWPEYIDRDLAAAVRPEIARWILFLQTDLAYRWPPGPLDQFGTRSVIMDALTFGWWERRKEERLRAWERHGDASVWPFLTREEFDRARSKPRFLVGSS
ncbi:MAG: hypothetical protein KAI24_13830 [Planctomycetes bacterium]|nr:hypothetical protein [Planctomycetota bacterium]